MKNKKKRIIVLISILLLISVVFSGLNAPSLEGVSNVTILKIFTSGVLTGVLLTLVRSAYLDNRHSSH